MKKQKLGSGVGFGHRTMRVEHLEGRCMLAGNVSVSVDGAGDLLITGDNNDNAVLVQQGAEPGDYIVTGFDFDTNDTTGFQGGPTNIHGGAHTDPTDAFLGGTSAVVAHGVIANIIINLKGGNDSLGVGNALTDLSALAEECGFGLGFGSVSASIDAPVNNQAVGLIPVDHDKLVVPLNLVINMGDGNNRVATDADVQLTETIVTGKGNDDVAVGFASGSGSGSEGSSGDTDIEIGSALTIVTGAGNDNICVLSATIGGALTINAGSGNNSVGAEDFDALAATVVTGNNDDEVFMQDFDLDTALTIVTGNANRGDGDAVFVRDFNAGEGHGPNALPAPGGGAVTIVTGNGNDSVVVEDFDANAVTINTGSGNDGGDNRNAAAKPLNSASQLQIGEGILIEDAEVFFDTNGDREFEDGEPLGPVTVVTGAGTDSARIEDITAGPLTVNLGTGAHDSLFVFDNLIHGPTTFVGAAGTSNFIDIDDNTFDGPVTIAVGKNSLVEFFSSSFASLVADGGGGGSTFDSNLRDANGDPIEANGTYHDGDGHLIVIKRFANVEFD